MADGSIVFDTSLDNKTLERQLNSLKRKVQSLNDQIYTSRQQQIPLVAQSKELSAQLDAAKATLYEMQTSPGRYGENAITRQTETVRSLQSQWNAVQNKVESYDRTIEKSTIQLDLAKSKAGAIEQSLSQAAPETEKMAQATDKMHKNTSKFALRLREVIRSALVFTVISQGLAQLREWLGNVISANDEAAAAIAKLKGALLTLAQPILNVVIPAFTSLINVLSRVVIAIARVLSALFGTTIEESADAAENLYNESNAIEAVGGAAAKAEKQLAGFDEINKLVGGASGGGGGSSGGGIAPDFSFINGNGILTDLKFTLEDILFDWENLTAEDVLAKIITVLGAITGAIIGFKYGGVGGAVLGIFIGAGLGLKISNLIFNKDGKLSPEELIKSIIIVLSAMVGAVMAFSMGKNLSTAAIGISIGATVGLLISDLIFDNDGTIGAQEIAKLIIIALFALAGGVLGFAVGKNINSALLGITLGATAGLLLSDMMFDNDGELSGREIAGIICVALGALAGGVIGFIYGGPGGAFLGVTVGAGVGILIKDVAFDIWEKLKSATLVEGLKTALATAAGGVIGFIVGGPIGAAAGAALGFTVGATLLIDVKEVEFKASQVVKNSASNKLGSLASSFTKNSSIASYSASLRNVPGLASGSVIPPNREFLAVLGDQKSGTNVEAPLATIEQALINALNRTGYTGGQQEAIFEVDGQTFAKLVYKYNSREGRLVGVTMSEA